LATPLKVLLTQFGPQHFIQVRRSVIVAQRHIAAAVRGDLGQMHLRLRGRSATLAVARQFQALFKGQ
jgi:DNA-binding LytR/AlgR family response regulator